jgi:hypothetical protein
MPRRLIPQVFEVSAVDKGAGRNCKIVLRKRDEENLMHEPSVADRVNDTIKTLVGHGVPLDHAVTAAHRAEVAFKRDLVAKNDTDPCTTERNAKLAWIDGEAGRLHKLGGRTTTEAINEAMRNWALQGNSPGQR